MPITLAELNVLLTASSKGFDRELNRATKKMDDFAATARRAAAKATVALAGIATAGGYLLKVASDAEELDNVIRQSFGSMAGEINKWAKDTGQALGRSTYQMRQFAGQMQAMVRPIMGSNKAAAEMSKQLAQLAVDMASFWNVADIEAFNALRAGIIGETEPLRRFGVVLTEASLKAWALERGLAANVETMSEAEKILLRYQYILAHTTAVQGDAARTLDSVANQQKALMADIRNLAEEYGRYLLPAGRELIKQARQIVQWFGNLDDSTKRQIVQWSALGAAVLGLVAVFGVVASGIAVFAHGLVLLGGIIGLVLNPIALAVLGVALAWDQVAPILEAIKEWERKTIKTIWDWVINGLDWISQTFIPWFKSLPARIENTWAWVVENLNDLKEAALYAVNKVVTWTVNFIQGTADVLKWAVNKVIDWTVNLIQGTAEVLKWAVDKVITWTVNLLQGTAQVLKWAVDRVISWTINFVQGAASVLKWAVDRLITWTIDLIQGTAEVLRWAVDKVITWTVNLVQGVADVLKWAADRLVTWTVKLMKSAEGAWELIQYAVDRAVTWTVGLVESSSTKLSQWVKSGVDLVARIIDVTADTASKAAQWLVDLLQGRAEAAVKTEINIDPDYSQPEGWGAKLAGQIQKWIDQTDPELLNFTVETALNISVGIATWVGGSFAVAAMKGIAKGLGTATKVFLRNGGLAFTAGAGLYLAIEAAEFFSAKFDLPLFKSSLWERFGDLLQAAGAAAVIGGIALGASPFWLTVGVGLALVIAGIKWAPPKAQLDAEETTKVIEAAVGAIPEDTQVWLEQQREKVGEGPLLKGASLYAMTDEREVVNRVSQVQESLDWANNILNEMESRSRQTLSQPVKDAISWADEFLRLNPASKMEQIYNATMTAGKSWRELYGAFDPAEYEATVRAIDKWAERLGIDPNQLAALAFVESRFQNIGNAASSAQGPLQVLKGTLEYVVSQKPEIESVANELERLVAAGAAYFQMVGSPSAYHLGPGGNLSGPKGQDYAAAVAQALQILQLPGFQHGAVLPGESGPDKFLAMVAPGEAIVPAKVVQQGAAAVLRWFRQMGVPGFQFGKAPVVPGLSQAQATVAGMQDMFSSLGRTLLAGFAKLFEIIATALEVLAVKILGEERVEEIKQTFASLRAGMEEFINRLFPAADTVQETTQGFGDFRMAMEQATADIEKQPSVFRDIVKAAESFGAELIGSVPVLSEAIAAYKHATTSAEKGGLGLGKAGGVAAAALAALGTASEELQAALDAVAQGFAALLEPLNGFLRMLGGKGSAALVGGGVGYLAAGLIGTINPWIGAAVGAIAGILGASAQASARAIREAAAALEAAAQNWVESLTQSQFYELLQLDPGDTLRKMQQERDRIIREMRRFEKWGVMPWERGAYENLKTALRDINKQIQEFQATAPDELLQRMAEVLGATIRELQNSVRQAFSADTIEDFTKRIGRSFKEHVRNALITAFLESSRMAAIFESLRNAIIEAVQDGVLTAQEKLGIQELVAQIQDESTQFYEYLDELGLGMSDLKDTVDGVTESLRNVPSGFKIALARFQAATPVQSFATGGYVPATPGGRIVRVAEGGEGEWIVPDSKMGGGGIVVHVNVQGNVYGEVDIERAAKRAVGEALRQQRMAAYGVT